MVTYLGLLALSLVVFGGGVFCGLFLFRSQPPVTVTLTDSGLAEPIEALQRTLYRFDRQLVQHVERMTAGADELKAAGITSSEFMKLIAANQAFEKQLKVFAAGVREVGSDLGVIDPDRGDSPATSEALSLTARPISGEREPNEPAANKYRTEQRHPFPCKQWIAPYSGVGMPESEEFFRVQCRDISSGGISFFFDRMPPFKMIVIRLSAEEPRYLTARIQRTVPSTSLERGRYIVGCKFLGTLHPSALPVRLEDSIRRREMMMAPETVAIA